MKKRGETQFPEGPPLQESLFDASAYDKPEPAMNYDPAAWIGRGDITYHTSQDPQMPPEKNPVPNPTPRQHGEPPREGQKTAFGYGFHHGDLRSAMDRGGFSNSDSSQIPAEDYLGWTNRPFIHPLRQGGSMALRAEPNEGAAIARQFPSEYKPEKPRTSGQKAAASEVAHPLVHTDAQGNDPFDTRVESLTIPYVNAAENAGSISFRSPRQNISTWAEDVAADPGASREHKLLAEQFDLTIPIKENWFEGRLSRPRWTGVKGAISGKEILIGPHPSGRGVKESPDRLSGPVHEQLPLPGTGGDTQVSGQSELHPLRPRFKRKEEPNPPREKWEPPDPSSMPG
jgi:hypothetical protein